MRLATLLLLATLAGCRQLVAPVAPATLDAHTSSSLARQVDVVPTPLPPVGRWDYFEWNDRGLPFMKLAAIELLEVGDSLVVEATMAEIPPGTFGVDWSANTELFRYKPRRFQGSKDRLDSLLWISGEKYMPDTSAAYWFENSGVSHLIAYGHGRVSESNGVVRFTCPRSMLTFRPDHVSFAAIHYVNGQREGQEYWIKRIRAFPTR